MRNGRAPIASSGKQLLVPVDQVGEDGDHDEDGQDDRDSADRVVMQRGYFGVVPEGEREQRRGEDQRGGDQDGAARGGICAALGSRERRRRAVRGRSAALLEGQRERRRRERASSRVPGASGRSCLRHLRGAVEAVEVDLHDVGSVGLEWRRSRCAQSRGIARSAGSGRPDSCARSRRRPCPSRRRRSTPSRDRGRGW
jgi:hypothetical protein